MSGKRKHFYRRQVIAIIDKDQYASRVAMKTWLTPKTYDAVQVAAMRRGLSTSRFVAELLMVHVEPSPAEVQHK